MLPNCLYILYVCVTVFGAAAAAGRRAHTAHTFVQSNYYYDCEALTVSVCVCVVVRSTDVIFYGVFGWFVCLCVCVCVSDNAVMWCVRECLGQSTNSAQRAGANRSFKQPPHSGGH